MAQNETAEQGRAWTYSLKCYDCQTINDFNCPNIRVCVYEIRRCLTVSMRLSNRELLVYKNCTSNCTFLYKAETPPEAPRMVTTNNFYWVRCCNSMTCNEGGPTLERDILTEETVEEEIEGAVRFGESTSFLIFVSTLVSSVLT
ncbi:glycosyl-phosphatidylinositol-anchored molecule-like protein [Pteropus alecto]|uniref:glycosyl-phosphatidylinositol-anchored molecule-like protein n=1 Tax=Pteropus alecto TaxID=9402 RepID=UPI0003F152A4|nr:glycosyl-phosphatidylinositol-anchored molecule-like protein [Pteropus alecto]